MLVHGKTQKRQMNSQSTGRQFKAFCDGQLIDDYNNKLDFFLLVLSEIRKRDKAAFETWEDGSAYISEKVAIDIIFFVVETFLCHGPYLVYKTSVNRNSLLLQMLRSLKKLDTKL